MPTRSAADPPSADALAWVARAAGGDEPVRWRRLTGGTSTATHLLRLRSGRELVLRRHRRATTDRQPDLVRGEAATLAHLAGRGLPVPELVAVDADGSATGGPAMLLTRLPGRIELAPREPEGWLQQMAAALAAIHDLPPVPDPDGTWTPGTRSAWSTGPAPALPDWSRHRGRWADAVRLLWGDGAGAPSPARPALVHGDFQHFNLLWSGARLTGIVDWGGRSMLPPDSDLGHCRLNLVILYGRDVADDFLRRYEALTGRTVDPLWDLFETAVFLPSWAATIVHQVGARISLDVDAMHRRVDDHLPAVLLRAQSTIDG